MDLHPALATSIREKNAGAVPRRHKIERWRTFFKCSENIPSSIGIKAPLKATEPFTFEGFNENQIFFQALCFSLRGFPGGYNWSRGRTWGTWLEFLLPQSGFDCGAFKKWFKDNMASCFWTCQSAPDQRWVIFHWKINGGAGAGGELGVLGACHERRAPEVGLPGCGQESKAQILGFIFNGVELGKPPAFRARKNIPRAVNCRPRERKPLPTLLGKQQGLCPREKNPASKSPLLWVS